MSNKLIHEVANTIREQIDGDVKIDNSTRILYSTDASIYQVMPLGVVFPRNKDDLVGIVQIAGEYGVSIIPRGSGSSLAGQAIGTGLIIDCSKYLNKIIDINEESNSAVVEPGVVLNNLNQASAIYGLKFGPDPASSDRATFGGMMGNNSTGAHSIQFGMTADHILSLDAVLSDGSVASFHELSLGEAERKSKSANIEGRFYQKSLDIKHRYGDLIKDRWPRTWRKATGYNLNYLLPWSSTQPPQWEASNLGKHYPPVHKGSLNLAPVLVGSEGTFVVFQQARINLVRLPVNTVLGVLSYDSVAEACDAAPEILKSQPSAVELIPQALIERARSVPAYAAKLSFVRGNPAALLVVEYEGENLSHLVDRVKKLSEDVVVVESKFAQQEIWDVRKVGLGLLMSIKGDRKPLPFVEDVAVPVENLGDFVREFEQIMALYNTRGDFYAHASAGCLHIRPLVNIKTLDGINTMREITAAVVELTVRMGGALSGEHGDGRARSEWLSAVFGDEVIQVFRDLKTILDPKGIFHPENKINVQSMDQNLRFGSNYQASSWEPIQDFSTQESLLGAIEMCNGAGVCRKSTGVMCPSFQASKNEMHSTRGRSNLLRAMVSGNFPNGSDPENLVFEALDFCLECKGCKAECPSGVDMAKIKYEFLHHYYKQKRRPVRDYLFGYIGPLAKSGHLFPKLGNFILGHKAIKYFGELLLGVSKERELPELQNAFASSQIQTGNISGESVILLIDSFTEYFYPDLANRTVSLLEKTNCHVYILPVIGSGRTLISKGFLRQAKRHAQKVLTEIDSIDLEGVMPIIGIEPSDIYTLRDEYLDLFPNNEKTKKLADRTYMIDEFMLRSNGMVERHELLKRFGEGEKILLHGHCYQKAQPPSKDGLPMGVDATIMLLEKLGYDLELIQSGCCGMAGSFGYESEHFELSMKIGELTLFPKIRQMEENVALIACGVSCRSQIETGTGLKANHWIELLSLN